MMYPNESPQREPAQRPIRVVVVDDELLSRQGVAAVLATADGIELVGEAGNGQEALAAFRQLGPDVLLMDTKMPVMNGIDALLAIKRLDRQACIVMLSAFAGDACIARAMKAGADGYILKDGPCVDIVAAIRQVHAGMQYMPQDVAIELAMRHVHKSLSDREVHALQLIAEGHANKEVANALGVTQDTVKGYVTSILAKLHAKDRTHAVVIAIRRGFLEV